jgi:hypothetical protein
MTRRFLFSRIISPVNSIALTLPNFKCLILIAKHDAETCMYLKSDQDLRFATSVSATINKNLVSVYVFKHAASDKLTVLFFLNKILNK